MSTYREFIFEDYLFDEASKTLSLRYAIDDAYHFEEVYTFDFPFSDFSHASLDRAIQLLFFMTGVSYYKTFLPDSITVRKGSLDSDTAKFISKTWQRGLGEFFYTNHLDPRTSIEIPHNSDPQPKLQHSGTGTLIGIGGGKDSLVSVELLEHEPGVSTWSVGHKPQLGPLVDRIGLPHLWIERSWDRTLLTLNEQGAYNGHVPISAILACAGVVTAVLSGKKDVVVSNEQSANEPTLEYQGVQINHQYSKSQEFERDFQTVLDRTFGDSLRYYSLLRPLSELRIAELFSHRGFQKYFDVFSSCNHAFTHNSERMYWDESCPKCCFVYLALFPFIGETELGKVFSNNLLANPALYTTYAALLGISGDKPLDCVGEIQESRAAMRLAQQSLPALAEHYTFDIPADYDFRALGSHCLPKDMWEIISPKLQM